MRGGPRQRLVMLRALRYRAGQNLVVLLVTALLAGAAAFAPWYHRVLENAAIKQAFAGAAAGGSWSLMAPGDADLAAVLPPHTRDLFSRPIAGRSATLWWKSPRYQAAVEGGIVSRDDACAHLVLVAGRCPARAGEVAVSADDAGLYGVGVGDAISQAGHGGSTLRVTAVYRLVSATDPYWFGTLPTQRSGFRGDTPYGDQLVTVPATFTLDPDPDFTSRLDLQVLSSRVTLADREVLRAATSQLRQRAAGRASVLTSMDVTLDRLDRSRHVAATTLVLMVAQVGVLGLAVLATLVGIALESRRRELGLGRLRGRSARHLVRRIAGEWSLVVIGGVVLGTLLGAVATLLARAAWVDHRAALGVPALLPVAVAGTAAVSVALMVLRARQVAGESIPALLRSSPSLAAPRGGAAHVGDAVVVTAALAALVVGLQSPGDSSLVLVAPSLLALAAGLVLARLLARSGAAVARRGLVRGRVATTLTGVLLARPRGVPALLTVLCAATAFAVFSTQVATVADRNRTHRAAVEAGAAGVLQTSATVPALTRALDRVDPGRQRATAVVQTRTGTTEFVSLMLVEPAAFRRIAHGAAGFASPAQWRRLRPPAGRPLAWRGPRLTGTIASRVSGPARLELDLRDDRGRAATLVLARRLGAGSRFDVPAPCAGGCTLLRWRIAPDDGPVTGRVRVTGLRGDAALEPGTAAWVPVLPNESYRMEARSTASGVDLDFRSGGLAVEAQHPWVPREVPAILSPEHASITADEDVPLPGQVELPLRVAGTGHDAAPRVLRNVAVADLALSVRLGGENPAQDMQTELWVSPRGMRDLHGLVRDLARHDVRVQVSDREAGKAGQYTAAPEALADRLGPAAGALAVLLAVLALLISVVAARRPRSRDLAALRLAGIPRRTLLRASYAAQLVLVLVAVAAGVGCGLLGADLALARLLFFADPEPAIGADLGLDLGLAASVGGLCAVVLGVVGVLSARQLVRGADPVRLQEYDG